MTNVWFGTVAALLMSGSLASAETLPVPPMPPDTQAAVEAAPVPNVDAKEPTLTVADEPRVNVRFYRAQTYLPGAGFTPGSRYQDSEERKPIQTPGLTFRVPLQ